MPDLSFEQLYGLKDGKVICGVDEVGRGPLAGPVVAAAVILPIHIPTEISNHINDSKKMSAIRREKMNSWLHDHAQLSIAEASVEEIDSLNILHASLLAMQRAIAGLRCSIDTALIDGNRCPALPCQAISLVKGDSKSLSIAAASIIAKVARDRLMTQLAFDHPHYGWEHNMGYGTAAHLKGLQQFGATSWHRRSFAPVAEVIRLSQAA